VQDRTAADFDAFNALVIDEFRSNGGRVAADGVQAPVILLHHRGRRTGSERVVPVAYLEVENGWAIFGSRGGSKWQPDWYLNLLAEPDTTVETAEGRVAVRAREVTGPARDRLWARHKQLHPEWNEYEKQAYPRVIPVLVLERRLRSQVPVASSAATADSASAGAGSAAGSAGTSGSCPSVS
jgi:deazaflavin-dependent oxidoreductase (nitroreductase family)